MAVRSTAAVYDVTAPDEAARDAALRPPGEWNTFAVTVAEGRVVVRLNGVVVTEHRETDPERLAVPAHVGLQNHSEVDRVSFRRVRVRDIDDEEG